MKKNSKEKKVGKLAQSRKLHIKQEEDFLLWYYFSKGDQWATSYIYKAHLDKLLEYGRQFAEPERVKDGIQEIFLDLMRKRIKPDQPDSIQAYLNACLKYKLLRKIKRDGIEVTESQLDQNVLKKVLAVPNGPFDLDGLLPNQSTPLSRAFGELPFRYRKALVLHYIKGLSHKEVAQVMKLNTQEAARSLVYRGKEQLKKLLLKMEERLEKVVY